MEKGNWFIRLSKWAWSPIILGGVICFGVIAAASEVSLEAGIAGLGIVCFAWLAMVKGFAR